MAAACNSGSSPFSPIRRTVLKANGLRVTVSTTSQDTGGLTFLIELKNEGTGTVTLNFSDSQTFDIAVSTRGESPVWQWSRDKYFLQLFLTQELKPGDAVSNRADWNLKANDGSQPPPGTYKAKVWITNYPRDPDLSVELSLVI